MASPSKTRLAFQYDGKLSRLRTHVHSVTPFAALEEGNRLLFKQGSDGDFVIVTNETIFHPQGGGQPSDEGIIKSVAAQNAPSSPDTHTSSPPPPPSSSSSSSSSFQVKAVRMDAVHEGQVLHLGAFTSPQHMASGDEVEQLLDQDKRLLYSRLHTAGHVLGSAVRSLLETQVPGFDELKASHFPDSAACEFQGAIEGRWKEAIQARVDEYVRGSMPVEIEFWTEDDFRARGLARLIPDRRLLPPSEDRFRVVRIVGAEVYPCGGTHVERTDLCGETRVKKIARSKGISRVSYTVS